MFGIDDFLIGALAGPIIGALGSTLFGSDESMPQRKANAYLDKIPGILEAHYGPFEQAGVKALPTLEQQYAKLLNNPEILMSQVGSSHRASPGYRFKTEEAIKAANQAAAAGGMLGSPSHQESLMRTVTGLADQDYYNYLQNALGLYGLGLSGQTGLANMGYNAASSLGEDLSRAALNQANLEYTTGQNKLARERGMWGSLGNALGTIGSSYFSRPSNISSSTYNPNAYWTSENLNPHNQNYMPNNVWW